MSEETPLKVLPVSKTDLSSVFVRMAGESVVFWTNWATELAGGYAKAMAGKSTVHDAGVMPLVSAEPAHETAPHPAWIEEGGCAAKRWGISDRTIRQAKDAAWWEVRKDLCTRDKSSST